ncbi:MAG: site-specific DNA-methyltransferase, partial [Bacteroidales bacterium]|nr:site-specific DNA-methyltransferase [Bacteroidales bacterium]
MKLTQHEINDLIERLQKGETLPDDYKYKLFPVKQKEYELVYGGKMRREDILANEDGVFPVPLQIQKIYNGKREQWKDGWRNIIVFGDNLQFLKTIYENKDPLIKNKVKGKVKLIYIDPPFGTGDEYDGNQGQKGYSAKTKGAEFVEFLRRRLIVAKEILAEDGSIFVRQDYHFGHYVKLVLDEVFGKQRFINDFVVNRISKKGFANRTSFKPLKYPVSNDYVFWYAKTDNYYFDIYKKFIGKSKEKWHSMDVMDVNPKPRPRKILGKEMIAPFGRKWMYSQENIYIMEKQGLIRLNSKGTPQYKVRNQEFELLDTNWSDIAGYSFSTGYPTENSEELLERIIKSTTKEGDIVLDFFGGSGTTAAVAEKLNRKWITCDIGKLAFYTIQKRLLNIESSKSIENPKQKYGKPSKSFVSVNTGHYDLAKIFELKQQEYSEFVMNLFEVEPKKKTT